MTTLVALAVMRILAGILLALHAYRTQRKPYESQVRDIRNLAFAGPRTSETVAVLLPPVELFLAGCLILGVGLPAANSAAAVLFIGFAVVVYSAMRRQARTDSGRLGGLPVLIGGLVMAVVLALGAVAGPQQLVMVQFQAEVLIVLGVVTLLNIAWQISSRQSATRNAMS
ncbi:hypothetical protein FCK90_10365 [Kocuria coralli]|uniref:Methylamine utilisation protein MauE domain-containing protein n=1 Tax=Kocuria coralli TaxID=1461025 RepID=A0A5J5KW37_9MICC|nr:MauE/DoxX family redox-associated membrane protein [Kocuria coralli]KAA9393814.1 hypothetical protein FCK90_10365 [Kocuria coralli]